jgi:signal transduction histidine kinase/ABC-type amino acid transport substrate-binding protein/ActR/RegA family two-component response regulator
MAMLALGALRAAPRQVVRVGLFPAPPVIFLDANGKPSGFHVDLLKEVAAQQNWDLQFVPGTWQEGLIRLQRGKVDLLPSVAYTAERDATLDFGQESILTVWSVVYANPRVTIRTIFDLLNHRIGVMRGDINATHFRDLCAQFNIPVTPVGFDTQEELLRAVESGVVDGGVTSNTFGYAQEGRFRIDRTPVVFSPFKVYYATTEGHHHDLLAALDTVLREGKEHPDSVYQRALSHWLTPQPKGGLPSWVLPVGLGSLGSLGTLILAVLVALVFRRQVQAATREIRALNTNLKQELAQRQVVEDQILTVAEGVGAATGASFLQDLVRHLAAASEADIAFVGEKVSIHGADGIRTLAIYMDGAPDENREWLLAGSVSEQVLREGLCIFPAAVQEVFPNDPGLRETTLQSYVGTALKDSQGRVLGLIGVTNRHPLSNPTLVASLLRIFSSRASAELERQSGEATRRELEQQMQHAQKLESLGVLAGGIAHDFNNLLTAMLGHLNVAQVKLTPGSQAMPHLESLERLIHRAADLTQQMLAYSGRGRFVVRAYDLNQVVQEVTHLLGVSIPKKIALRFDLAEGLPLVEADAAQIQQVIMNLVTNAADAIGDREGIIRIITGTMALDRGYLDQVYQGQDLSPGTFVSLEVSDNGCGMTPEVQHRIFDPFFTTKVTGRGLGLSATMGILKGHHAGVRIYSEPGRGTTFKLLFPTSEARRVVETLQVAAPALMQEATVLLVDDEEMIRESAAAALESLGLTVVMASDGLEAVELVQRTDLKVDLVLMDLTMPRMDGKEAFLALRRLRPNLPVVLSSGYSEQELAETFADRGLAGFLQKPYTLKRLEQMVLALLAKARPES